MCVLCSSLRLLVVGGYRGARRGEGKSVSRMGMGAEGKRVSHASISARSPPPSRSLPLSHTYPAALSNEMIVEAYDGGDFGTMHKGIALAESFKKADNRARAIHEALGIADGVALTAEDGTVYWQCIESRSVRRVLWLVCGWCGALGAWIVCWVISCLGLVFQNTPGVF